MDDTCRTEVDGLCATWRLLRPQVIAVLGVESVCDSSSVLCFGPGSYPDLARARELHPELAGLWDGVRHEFWGKLISPGAGGIPASIGNGAEYGHNGVNPEMRNV